uniref:G-protein coupled receptor family C group 6 member A n=1 Tax=Seriola dumerili TaxID=41447 RepID=A0A3B4V6Y8_SERDU
MFLSWLFVSVMSVFHSCSGEHGLLRAYSPGDIIIGGLFPIHLKTNRTTANGPISCSMFLRTQVMIYAIREINQHTVRILPNFTIGYDIYDTCGDVGLALRATLQLLKNQSDPQRCLLPANIHSALPDPQTKVVIGERYSEVSIAVSRISYGSTSEVLSQKLKFPTFLRTISSDEYQTKAIAELVNRFNWKTVAIVGSNDEYGKYGSDRLGDTFRRMDICVEFTDILPSYFFQNDSRTHARLATLVSKINKSTAEAIITFTKGSNIEIIMEAAIKLRLNRTWIASDSWSTSPKVSALPGVELAGQVFGFISKRNEVPGFKDYIISMFNSTINDILEDYLVQFPLSVQVIAEGLRRLLKCDNQHCKRNTKFTASELYPALLKEIQKVNFTVNSTHIFFNTNGDPNLGYDIVYWHMDISTRHWPYIVQYMANMNVRSTFHHILLFPRIIYKYNIALILFCPSKVTVYNCSKTCSPGQELKQQSKQCCKDCVPCADGEFSRGNGKCEECQSCGLEKYSTQQRDECLNKTLEFLYWTDPFIIILSLLEVFGIIVTIVFTILFTVYRNTPIVKAVGGYLCFLELFSLLACFSLTFTFTGRPTKVSCMVGLPLFGIAFSLCISCILANLLQILVGFSFELNKGSWLKKLNKPLAVVTIVSGIQLALCVPWLYYKPPFLDQEILSMTILLQCDKGSTKFFIAMLGYNAFLALICFMFAFKGKQLPDLYKNANLITISMLLFLIIWILFIPIYLNLVGKYKRAIESAAILISSYSILGCHLAPKCYIMLFRKEINNENAITEYIRKHYEQRDMAVVKS